jgi:hypothetical protein
VPLPCHRTHTGEEDTGHARRRSDGGRRPVNDIIKRALPFAEPNDHPPGRYLTVPLRRALVGSNMILSGHGI